MSKIVVIGIMGAGKSTFASKLGQALKEDVYHLDSIYWRDGWQRIPKDEWLSIQEEIVAKPYWIIDGNYQGTLDMRLQACDTVVFFNYSKWICLYRIFRRAIFPNPNVKDKATGVPERVTWSLIKKVLNYPANDTKKKLRAYAATKKIFVVRNDSQANEVFKTLTNSH